MIEIIFQNLEKAMFGKLSIKGTIENLRIRTNNIIAISIFRILSIYFGRIKNDSKILLFINTRLLGDLIISSIIFNNEQELAKIYKKIYFLIDKKYSDLFKEYNGSIEIIKWNNKKYKYNLFYRLVFLNMIKKYKIGEVINVGFTRKIIEDEITLLTGAMKKRCFTNNPSTIKSFSRYMDSLYDEVIKPETGNNFNDLTSLLKQLGIVEPKTTSRVYLRKQNYLKSQNNLIVNKSKQKIISIAPFSSQPFREWKLDNYISLIKLLTMNNLAIIYLLGEKKDRKHIRDKRNSDLKIIDKVGLTNLAEVSAIISISDLFIGNDSGLFHLAKAIKIKRICIAGGGAFNISLPYSEQENEIILYKEMTCFGCLWNCIYNNPICLHEVTVDEVYRAAQKLMNNE